MRKKLAVFLAMAFAIAAIGTGLPARGGAALAATKGTVTTDGLRVRKGAGTDKAILTYRGANVMLYNGAALTIQGKKTADKVVWYKVTFAYEGKKMTGYVSGDYVKVKGSSGKASSGTGSSGKGSSDASSGKGSGGSSGTGSGGSSNGSSGKETVMSKGLSIPGKASASDVNVRKGAGTSYAKLAVSGKGVTLKKGAAVKITKEVRSGGEKWYGISFTYEKKTRKGYVLSDYVKLTLSRDVSATVYDSGAKVRKGAGKDKAALKVGERAVSLKKGTKVTVTKESKGTDGKKWLKVRFDDEGKARSGYVEADQVALKSVVAIKGKSTTDGLRMRTGPGTKYPQATANGEKVTLRKGQAATVKAHAAADGVTWYKISVKANGVTVTGYVSGEYFKLVEEDDDSKDDGKDGTGGSSKEDGKGDSSKGDEDDAGTEKGDSSKEDGKDDADTEKGEGSKGDGDDAGTEKGDGSEDDGKDDGEKPEAITDIDGYLAEQGFPESYKPGLASLLKAHPTWKFKAYDTGLSWDEALEKECKVGLNLISNNKANGWKSYEKGAYDYSADKFVVFDGSTWVTASKDAVAYYMDPRNFMSERGIFQFLTLEYEPSYEKKNGVENILANTPFYGAKYAYLDEETAKEVTKTYGETFMEAAEASGVSPYHLATRVKQEVVSNSATVSGSASGKFSGYEGYYNFYNIGATHSTAADGAIANGLKFAMGSKSSASDKATYLLPWNNPYRAIVGGATYIGKQYINRGQNTIYLQKFNVTGTSTYSHQYMANVEAANSEAIKLYNGYASVLDQDLVFYVPIYDGMPTEKAGTPGSVESPNSWLKTLTVGSYELTPKFDAKDGAQDYALSLEDEDVDEVSILAVAASKNASISIKVTADGATSAVSDDGNGLVRLAPGENVVKIKVTAENGSSSTYQVTITK